MSLWIFLLSYSLAGADSDPDLQVQMESAAKRYSRFSTSEIVKNQSQSERRWPREMLREQADLRADLLCWSKQPAAVRTLIRHPDPKVRTLVLGTLCVLEEPHDLPLINALVDDKSPTFIHIHQSLNSAPVVTDLTEFESPQTVGEVARAILAPYLATATSDQSGTVAEQFDRYWSARRDRQTCAGWFLVKTQRATRNVSPLQPEFQADLARVLKQLDPLSVEDRAWTQVYLRCLSFTALDSLLTDTRCLADLKQVGSRAIVQFLQRQRVCADPDLQFEQLNLQNGRTYSWMAHFILEHADELLTADDAPRLLDCERDQQSNRAATLIGPSPAWAAAAARLVGKTDRAAASQIINAAVERFPLDAIQGGPQQAVLLTSYWQIHGIQEQQRVVDWFYQLQARAIQASHDESNNGAVDFLDFLRSNKREDKKDLMTALIADPRLDQTDWPTLKRLIQIASEGLPHPLVSDQDLYRARRDPQSAKILTDWRTLLRHHYQSPPTRSNPS
ncbi:MAG: hypothetical protein JSS49_20835 [Planctomycetes bacterium]|nr:hypothetical protein [Planctomycetota bacterium]